MHMGLLLISIGIACGVRLLWARSPHTSSMGWAVRWQRTLFFFLFSPLLMVAATIAVLSMGHHGLMLGYSVGRVGCLVSLAFVLWVGGWLAYRMGQAWRSWQHIRTYPSIEINQTNGRLLNTSALFAAQVGLWESELVVSQGLLDGLTPKQLNAVLAHEQAHVHHRDTFWFFWLGWIRQFTAWLPHTEALWQELLLLRELRADGWAAQQVDPLLLAESLLAVVQAPLKESEFCVAFEDTPSLDRLEERIEALLTPPEPDSKRQRLVWMGLLLALLPLVSVLLHTSLHT